MAILRYRRQATNALSRMNRKQAREIRSKLHKIATNRDEGLDIKRLKGTNTFRLRIGKYRAEYFFSANRQILFVNKIGSRGDFYK